MQSQSPVHPTGKTSLLSGFDGGSLAVCGRDHDPLSLDSFIYTIRHVSVVLNSNCFLFRQVTSASQLVTASHKKKLVTILQSMS